MHEFARDLSQYAGFLPNFILYLANESYVYQIYIEPKGDHLLNKNQWKEDLLMSISPEIVDVIGENNQVNLHGVKVYLSGDRGKISDSIHEFILKKEKSLE